MAQDLNRKLVVEGLLKVEKSGFSNLVLPSLLKDTRLSSQDKAFISNLFYGTIERKITLNHILQSFISKPLKKLDKEVLAIMQSGLYQILYMNSVPSFAAINQAVGLCSSFKKTSAKGLVNAVLRKVSANGVVLPDEKDKFTFLSVKYSCPVWLIKKWFNEYGETDTVEMLKSSVGEPPLYIRVNNTLTDVNKLKESLSEQGIESEFTEIKNSLRVHFSGKDIEKTDAYKNGLFHVQDLASQICAAAVDAQPGQTVFDLCSAPGGKAYTVAENMNNEGKVLCFDIYESRVKLIKNGANRLGLDIIQAQVSDASVFNSKIGKADRVLCDVPCSGLGIIRRKPEIKYKNADEFSDLPEIQYSILKNASSYVKPEGRLIYSTCTLSKAENDNVVDRFLAENNDFEADSFAVNNQKFSTLTLMPHKNNSDGFFISVFRRK